MNCNKELSECICPDLEERLESLKSMSNVVTKWCTKCDKHYSQCKCKEPEFVAVNNGKVVVVGTKKPSDNPSNN
jgi:hypothetical protein